MKWWQNHVDVIIILTIWRQDYEKEKGEMAPEAEIVTDVKNNKTE